MKANMGCYNHPSRTVVANCPKCGKFMCKECAEKYESKLCDSCEKERLEQVKKNREAKVENLHKQAKNVKKDTIKDLVVAAVLSIVCAVIGFSIGNSDGNGLSMAWMFAGFPWGWKLINQVMTGNLMGWLIVLTEKFWIVAYIIKFALALFIGMFTWPIIIGYKIYLVVKANNLEKDFKKM